MRRSIFPSVLIGSILFGLFLLFESLPDKKEKDEVFNRRLIGYPSRIVKRNVGFLYRVFIPDGWDSHSQWPVILFLHGKSERGHDKISQTEVGLGPIVKKDSHKFPAIVVFPQCSEDAWWTDSLEQEKALRALFETVQEFNGDTSRLYLTGISMGGYGVWSMAAHHPNVFAAIAPVCGGIRSYREIPAVSDSADPYRAVAEKIKYIPVYIFHGRHDKTIPFTESQKMRDALQKLGRRADFKEYTFSGHAIWDSAYIDERFRTKMFFERRK